MLSVLSVSRRVGCHGHAFPTRRVRNEEAGVVKQTPFFRVTCTFLQSRLIFSWGVFLGVSLSAVSPTIGRCPSHYQHTGHFALLKSVFGERGFIGAVTLNTPAAAPFWRRQLSLLAGSRSFTECWPSRLQRRSCSSNSWGQIFGKWRVLPQRQYVKCR